MPIHPPIQVPISIKDLAKQLDVKVPVVIRLLVFDLGIPVSGIHVSSMLDAREVKALARLLGIELVIKGPN